MVNPRPRELADEHPRGRKSGTGRRVLVAIAGWVVALLIVPAVLVNYVSNVQQRQRAARLPLAGEVDPAVAPGWVPVRDDFRVSSAESGRAAMETADPVGEVRDYYLREFRRSGFSVGANQMQQDGETASLFLNASDGRRSALVTLRSVGGGTKIDLTYSEKN